ncbi:hypothetical protein ACWIUD_08190 [Helicobacter sp. 23-1044]
MRIFYRADFANRKYFRARFCEFHIISRKSNPKMQKISKFTKI